MITDKYRELLVPNKIRSNQNYILISQIYNLLAKKLFKVNEVYYKETKDESQKYSLKFCIVRLVN